MKKFYLMTVFAVVILFSGQAAFSAEEAKPKPAEKKIYTDAHKQDKVYYYDAMASLKRAKSELAKVSAGFEKTERDSAMTSIDAALKELDSVMAKHK
jgi:hypothetical protein